MNQEEHKNIDYRTCNLCEAMCGIEVLQEDGKVISIKPDKNDPLSKGHICPKAVALKDIHEDPDRLKHPVVKTDKGWERVSWSKAFDIIGTRINKLVSSDGRDSMALYMGNPTVHNLGSTLFVDKLVDALNTKNVFSATSVDQLPHHFASYFQFGHSLLIPIPDVDRTDYMVIMGGNPLASNGSLMSAPGIEKRLRAIQGRGGKVVVVDPRRTETAEMADEYHPIPPGEDVFLLLSILHVIFKNNRVRLEGNQDHIINLNKIREAVEPWSPEVVAGRTRISSDRIENLATEFSRASKSVCYGRMGLSTQKHGGLCQWLINVLNIVTGNFDTEGGALFASPAVDIVRGKSSKTEFGRWKSRIRGLPEFKGELPVSVLAEEILTPGKGQVKGLITLAGNPVLSTPNGRQMDEALAQLDFMVSIDVFINETTRHADIILPPPTHLEVDHYDLVFNAFTVRNTAKYSPALFRPEKGSMYDWEIIKKLAARISGHKSIWDRFLTPTRMLDLALKLGPYGSWKNLFKLKPGLNLEKLKMHPHGIDLGPLQRQVPEKLKTPSRKIDLAPSVFLERLQEVSREQSPMENERPGRFRLIGRRHVRNNNSWMHNFKTLMSGKNRCILIMNEKDALDSGLSNGQQVRVKSRVGEVEIPLETSNDIMEGVVSIPHGFGHNREGTKIRLAEQHAGVSINDLMDDREVDPLTGNAAFSGQWVQVVPVDTEY